MVQTLQSDSLEERVAQLNELRKLAGPEAVADYSARLDMSWIYHDSALEGVVYTQDELRGALFEDAVAESTMIPIFDEIRHHKAAIEVIRDLSQKKRFSLNLDVIKQLFGDLAPEELEGKSPPKYRKEMPLHRLYFHDIAQPEKISYRMRQLVQWVNAPETKRSTHPVRLAARTHYQLLHIYPFPRHSGKVARLVLNLLLMRAGYPPVIIHATERQRYYEALKQSENATANIVNEALVASVESTIRYFEELS